MRTVFSIYWEQGDGEVGGELFPRCWERQTGVHRQHAALAAQATPGFLASRLLVGEDQRECAEESHRLGSGEEHARATLIESRWSGGARAEQMAK